MASLVIFDFDGTLFDTHASIAYSVKLTFDALAPGRTPPADEIQRHISAGTGLFDTFKALTDSAGVPFDEAQWTATYRAKYATEGQPLTKAFPGAEELLRKLKGAGIPVAIVSNKGAAAVIATLERNGLADLVPKELIVGDGTPGATRKPDTASYDKVLAPQLRAIHGAGFEAASNVKILEVGDTVADIEFARNLGGKSCWCRFGYGDAEACQKLKPDFAVHSLAEVFDIAISFSSEL